MLVSAPLKLASIYLKQNPVKNKTVLANNPIKTGALMSAVTASAIAAAAMVQTPSKITETDVNKFFKKNSYRKHLNGDYSKELSINEKRSINEDYGNLFYQQDSLADSIIKVKSKPISKDEVKDFVKFLNVDKHLGIKMLNENFDNLIYTFKIVHDEETFKNVIKDKNIFKLVANTVMHDIGKGGMQGIFEYKGKTFVNGLSGKGQMMLREKYNNPDYKIEKKVQKYIDGFSNAIDTQVLPEGLKLYRGESTMALSKVKLDNGEIVNLGSMMDKAYKNPKEINKVLEFILDNEITVVQPAFMSTSILNSIAKGYSFDIVWEFQPEKNTKGIFVEASNPRQYLNFSQEVVIQKGSNIKIVDAKYDYYKNQWILKAKVSN